MATTEHFRNGGGTTFSFVFPILANSDLKVEIYNDTTKVWDLKTENTSGQTDNDYTISNTNVVFNSATPSGTGNVHIYRNTNVDNPAAVYAAGSSIRAVDLNDNQTQILYSSQEAVGQLVRETDLKDSIVTSAKIVDNTIVNADISPTAAIAGTKVTPSFGSQNLSTTGTAATGALTVTGNIAVSGTVDSRDVAADGTKLDTIETNAKDDQTAAEIKTLLQSNKITDSEIETGTLDNRYYTETELLNGALDGRYFTETEADARYYNLASAEEIQSGETWTAADNKVATTAAIDARIVDLVDDVGGFVPIANELSFPNANPDVNNGAGTLVSIKALSQNLTSNGSGVVSIGNGSLDGNTVVINGLANNTTYTSTFGMLVETTTTLHTYTFHRLVPKATEVTTVAGNNSNISTVAGISGNVTTVAGVASSIPGVAGIASNVTTVAGVSSNVTTVAGISGNVTTVAGISGNVTTVAGNNANVTKVANVDANVTKVANIDSDVTTVANIDSDVTAVANDATDIGAVAGKATEIGRLGTADAVADLAILGTTDVVADMNTLATSANVTAMDNCSDDIANINTVSGSISNVNTVATNITNVNNASTYLNNFLSLYLGEAASDPTTDALGNSVTEGDLYWNNVTKQLRLYNGNVWQGISDNALELTKIATSDFSTVYTASAGNNNIDLGGLAITGAAFSNESIATNRMSLAKGSATYNLGGI